MTMPSSVSRARFRGNGTATEFPFAFKVWDVSQLTVTLTDPEDKSYVAAGWTAELAEDGGTVTYLHEGNPLPAGWLLAITRNMPFTQDIDLVSATRFDPAVMEDGLDVATAERQQLREQLSRSVILPPTSEQSPQEMADRLLDAEKQALHAAQRADTAAATATQQAGNAEKDADRAAMQAAQADDAARLARVWAESPTPPDPDDPDSKSAREWALIAADTVPTATAILPGKASFPPPFTIDAQGAVGIRNADTIQNGLVCLTDAVDSATGTLAASDTAVKTLNDRLNSLIGSPADSRLWIGVPRPWRSTSLPPAHCWANGDFVAFADWPELKAVYEAGGFEGLLLDWDADGETQAANLGQWRPDAAEPTGLYTPNLTGQFLRAWGQGDEARAGGCNAPGLPNIAGSYGNVVNNGEAVGDGALHHMSGYHGNMGAGAAGQAVASRFGIDASRSNPIYGASATVMPPSINTPYIIYLGNPAKETA